MFQKEVQDLPNFPSVKLLDNEDNNTSSDAMTVIDIANESTQLKSHVPNDGVNVLSDYEYEPQIPPRISYLLLISSNIFLIDGAIALACRDIVFVILGCCLVFLYITSLLHWRLPYFSSVYRVVDICMVFVNVVFGTFASSTLPQEYAIVWYVCISLTLMAFVMNEKLYYYQIKRPKDLLLNMTLEDKLDFIHRYTISGKDKINKTDTILESRSSWSYEATAQRTTSSTSPLPPPSLTMPFCCPSCTAATTCYPCSDSAVGILAAYFSMEPTWPSTPEREFAFLRNAWTHFFLVHLLAGGAAFYVITFGKFLQV